MPFACEPFLTHAGSNNMNLATIMLRPEQDWDGYCDQHRRNEGRRRAEGSGRGNLRQL
jgi:hypothetical protein